MKELSYVYAVFTAYYAFIDTINCNPATDYNLHEEGIYFDTLDLFKKTKLQLHMMNMKKLNHGI